MRRTSIITAAIAAAALLLTAPAMAQAPQSPAPAAKAATAKDSIGKVTWDKVAGNWKRFKGSMRRQWGRLTDNEVQVAKGNREALNGYIQTRYGIDKEKADKQIDDWLKTLK
jgi:uncharacterized protein YjbJ (UPF0337 family)